MKNQASGENSPWAANRRRLGGTEQGVFASDEVRHVGRNKWLLGASLLPALVAVLAAPGFGNLVFAPFVVPLVALAVVLPYWIWRKNPMPRLKQVSARADEQGLQLDGRPVLRADELSSGVLVPQRDSRPWVRLKRKGLKTAVQLQVYDEETGRDLLRALGRDASQAVACFRGSSLIWKRGMTTWIARLGLSIVLVGGIVAASQLGSSVVTWALLGLAVPALLVGYGSTSRIDIGGDGLRVRWLTYERFIPWAAVLNVTVREAGFGRHERTFVRLSCRGETVELPIAGVEPDKGTRAGAQLLLVWKYPHATT